MIVSTPPEPRGYIALISVIIISIVLLTLTMTVSASGYYARFNGLDHEYKRVSLGIAESCVNAALLKIAQIHDYQLVTDPAYNSSLPGVRVSVGASSCVIKEIAYVTGAHNTKSVTISTTGEYKGTFSNITTTATVQDSATASVIQASLTVIVTMTNDDSGTKQSGDVNLTISAGNPSISSFIGASTGTVVYFDPGPFQVSIPTLSGYQAPHDSGCAGGAVAGQHYDCTIAYDDIPTTASLTLVPSIINDNHGTNGPSDFLLYIDGRRVQPGVPLTGLTPGAHTATYANASGYVASAWGDDCSASGAVSLSVGDSKTCKINFNDETPPSPSCADVVMMLDRTGSIFSNAQNPKNEAIAAKSLLSLYDTLSDLENAPRAGVGGFGALYPRDETLPAINEAQVPDGSASQPASGLLTDNFGHDDIPNTVRKVPTASFTATYNQWTSPNNAFADDALYATDNREDDKQAYKNFGFNLPAGVIVNGIEVRVKGKASHTVSGQLGLRLSWNSGTNWSVPQNVHFDTAESEEVGGSATYAFGRTWSASDFSDANFALRLENKYLSGYVLSVNAISVTVHYTVPATGLFGTVNALMDNGSSSTNLSSAIAVGAVELNSARHRSAAPKVLIVVSDGEANVPYPLPVAAQAAKDAAAAAKNDGIAIYTIHYGYVSGRDLLAQLATTSTNDASTSWVQSRIDAENNDNDYFYISPTSDAMRSIFETIGRRACPALDPVVNPPSSQATLIIVTHVINDSGGLRQASSFTMTVSANNPSQSSFSGVASPGIAITVEPGTYSVDESNVGAYSKSIGLECSSSSPGVGPITASETRVCTITNDDVPGAPPPPPPLPPLPPQITINSWQERP